MPVSSSREISGAPTNAPSSTGTTNIRLETVCAPPLCSAESWPPQYVEEKVWASCWRLTAAAGWQAVTAA